MVLLKRKVENKSLSLLKKVKVLWAKILMNELDCEKLKKQKEIDHEEEY